MKAHEFCAGRCTFKTVKESRIEKKGPTGHPSGVYGWYQFRECSKCGSKDGRWKPKPRKP